MTSILDSIKSADLTTFRGNITDQDGDTSLHHGQSYRRGGKCVQPR
jgi:hypothetical protein